MKFFETLEEGSRFLHDKFGNSNPIIKRAIQGLHTIIQFLVSYIIITIK
jgi:hypothetical protein